MDHYETLEVDPRASSDTIAAAYQRLRALYDSAKLEGAAEELQELARARRDAIERAYAVLGDPVRRASYDAEQMPSGNGRADSALVSPHAPSTAAAATAPSATEQLDYRPLPPARRAERPRGAAEPTISAVPAGGRSAGAAPAQRITGLFVLLGLAALVVAVSLMLTSGAPTGAAPTPTAGPFDALEAAIPQARSAAEQNPSSAQAWADLGNVLYDSVQVVRESAPESPLYQQRLPRWLEATEAYSKSLALDPGNAAARADMGASSCFYGAGTRDQSFVRNGLAEVRRAAQQAPADERVRLSLGECLVSLEPPQTKEAIALWRQIIEKNPSSQFAAQINQLLAKYGQ